MTIPGPAGTTPLPGRRNVVRDADGSPVVTVGARAGDGSVTLARRRTVDPRTGLVIAERETLVRRLNRLEMTTTSTTTLTTG